MTTRLLPPCLADDAEIIPLENLLIASVKAELTQAQTHASFLFTVADDLQGASEDELHPAAASALRRAAGRYYVDAAAVQMEADRISARLEDLR